MNNSTQNVQVIATRLETLLSTEEPFVTLFANAAAFIYEEFQRLNWAGFYFLRENRLYLGPFIGKPACTVIEQGKGVCGAALIDRKTLVVPNVNLFPGHIVCDVNSRSEIVLPLILPSGRILGVLDLDSAELDRFSAEDSILLESLRDIIIAKLDTMIANDEPIFA